MEVLTIIATPQYQDYSIYAKVAEAIARWVAVFCLPARV